MIIEGLYQSWSILEYLWRCSSQSLIGGLSVVLFLPVTKQLYYWFSLPVCLSVFTMLPSSYHHEIFRSYYHWQKWCSCKSQFQKSKVKVTEVKTLFSRFQTVTPVWIDIWPWNAAQSLKYRRSCPIIFQGHPSKFKVTRRKKLPILTRTGRFQTVTPVWIHWWLWNDAQSLK